MSYCLGSHAPETFTTQRRPGNLTVGGVHGLTPFPVRMGTMRAFASDRIGGPRPVKKQGKTKERRGTVRQFVRRLFLTVLILMVLSWMLVLPFRWINPPTSAFMLQDNSGRIPVAYEWLDWADLRGAAPIAVIASEDQKFAHHFGFDVKSIRESIDEFNDGEPLRGASTISQQVAKNMYLWSGKNFLRKGVEAYFTILIEATWSKRRILEIYLNIAEFGPGIYGVAAASNNYFKKPPLELSNAEAALLAAVLPNPNRLRVDAPTQYVRERQRWIMQQMQRLHQERWITLVD